MAAEGLLARLPEGGRRRWYVIKMKKGCLPGRCPAVLEISAFLLFSVRECLSGTSDAPEFPDARIGSR